MTFSDFLASMTTPDFLLLLGGSLTGNRAAHAPRFSHGVSGA